MDPQAPDRALPAAPAAAPDSRHGDAPPSPPPPASAPAKHLVWLILAVVAFAVLLFLVLGDAWGRYFPSQ